MSRSRFLRITEHRRHRKWATAELVGRVLWAAAWPLFRLSPRPLWGWRRFVLRLFGAQVGENVHVYPTVRIQIPWNLSIGDHSAIGDRVILYCLGPVHIGAEATLSQHAHLCAGTHEYEDPTMPLLKPPISIGDAAWICADAFVGPGVQVGEGAIVGARAVVTKDVDPWCVVAGNPARFIKHRHLAGDGRR